MTQQERDVLTVRANGFRKFWGLPIDSGLVYFAQGKPRGWIPDLWTPGDHNPGVIAVDSHCAVYRAVYGDWENGAKEWGVV